MRKLLPLIAAGLVALAAPSQITQAQAGAFPEKPIRIVVPFPPGQASDLTARLFGERIGATLGQPVVVENRVGGGGVVGTEAGARARPDGYTLTLATAALPISRHVHRLSFDPVTGFQPITQFTVTPLVLAINPALPAASVEELIALAKKNPGKMTFASSGAGTSHHLAGELFKALSGTDILHVPYRGSAAAHVDMIGGRVDMMFDNIMPLTPHLREGTLRALAVTTPNRAPTLPDVPTIAQAGLPTFEAVAWFGLLAPAGTPREIVDRIDGAVQTALREPDVLKRLAEMGAQPSGAGPDAFARFIAAEVAKWEPVVETANIRTAAQQ